MIRLSPGALVRQHTVVYTLAVEHLTPAGDVRLAMDHRLHNCQVLRVLGPAGGDRPHDATVVQQQLAVDVSAGVVEDEALPLVPATVEKPTFTISAAL